MSSTTIRYSGVPENSHSRDFDNSRAYIGLRHLTDGYYDWAGRRLLLTDGSPDPLTPGAYRFQHSPDLCDQSARESDPASPRYEPPHLRHQPGDTYEIGGKPDDPDDPGVFGSPGWQPDTRTGRHRRGELPDPMPPEEPSTAPVAKPDFSDRSDRPSTGPRRNSRFWREAHEDRDDQPATQEQSYQFSRLREEAWTQFLLKSEPLAAAHEGVDHNTDRMTLSAIERECGPVLRPWIQLIRWIISVFRAPERDEAVPELPESQGQQGNQAEHEVMATSASPNAAVPVQRKPSPHPQRSPGSLMAQAINGARMARAEREDPKSDEAIERHWRERPVQERARRTQYSPFIREWEEQFDTGSQNGVFPVNLTGRLTDNLAGGLAEGLADKLTRGAAWA
ncbi:hypothetical protein [Glycomyces algeriensis]|uniref:Uncharacterized protein n=1 Tax=Glycomyces algeriensis TaxID=256037 RepID=A0A9W6GD09_9ACTN|nr:hypothetical protein [Glycomyces algeriensis]MDA1368339.1 hypothetical protein [Glycomyces algeriensis]MDR7351780.1 hypothetical protein [Glycomyces algeriensis]GLI44508.1 hypothetical protein GALLR39Z86_43580 [Glycomyces algeriensis]